MDKNAMQQCIEECLNCHRMCLGEAMTHCLEAGGQHMEPEHFRLMLNCAEMCQTSANFMLSGSPLHKKTCGLCAEVCLACAQSCEKIEGMEECAQTCRRCALEMTTFLLGSLAVHRVLNTTAVVAEIRAANTI
jgi:hypothetical protein